MKKKYFVLFLFLGYTGVAHALQHYVRTHRNVTFTGAWQAVVGGGNDRYGIFAQASEQAGDSVELDFIGTSVSMIHRAGNRKWVWGVIYEDSSDPLGLAEVWIDGKRVKEINTSVKGNTLLAENLPPGEHHVKVVNLGRTSKKSGPGKIVFRGFSTDAKEPVWNAAAEVAGGAGWRRQAVELARNGNTGGLSGLIKASKELEQVMAPIYRLCLRAPDTPMSKNEKKYWTPDPASAAYGKRLIELEAPIRKILTETDQFRWDAGHPEAFAALLADARKAVRLCDDFFQAEVRRLPRILFFTGDPLISSAVPNAIWASRPVNGRWGCSIRIFDPAHPERPAETIFSEPDSILFDLALSYDAKKILFSMRRHRAPVWQIYEIGIDGKGLRQLTEGNHHNVSPALLPTGKIAFVSSRTPGYHTVCQSGPSTHLHVMNGDGTDVRRLSGNTLSDFDVRVLRDGRLLFTRWEYIDVNLTYRQSLWSQYPDGRQFALWFGNLAVDPASFCQTREIPGRYSVVGTFASHHYSPHGAIGIISNRMGPDSPKDTGFRIITREFPAIQDLNLFWSYCQPFPVTGNQFLASYGGGGKNRFRICLLDEMDNQVTVYDDPATSCFFATPLRPSVPPAVIPEIFYTNAPVLTVKAAPPGQPGEEKVSLGRLLVSDVRKGFTASLPDGEIKSIRIMEQMPKTMNRTWNFVMDQGPLMSASTYYAKRVWGYAPVESDGSAYFEIPALKEIYLQLCDAEGRELQRMTSAVNLMPGETQSCVGCHENRQASGMQLPSLAARRAPTPLRFPEWGNAGVLDYNRIVQPVFNTYCVRCHSGTNPPKGLSLTGHYTRFFNMSYDNLVNRSNAENVSRAVYMRKTKQKPLVQSLHLLYGIMEPFRPKSSGSFASRLPDYLEKAHCKQDIPLAERRKVYEWIDAMIPYYPTSNYAHLRAKSNRDKWGDKDKAELFPWFTQKFAPVYTKKCASCHEPVKPDIGLPANRQWSWLDLTRPEWSPALTAHLAKEAGGRGIPAKDFSFRDTKDPDYLALLDAIREAGRKALETPEADMPGFINRSKGFGEYRP